VKAAVLVVVLLVVAVWVWRNHTTTATETCVKTTPRVCVDRPMTTRRR
jgi:hypothetical protein